jgi:hypothetical protein
MKVWKGNIASIKRLALEDSDDHAARRGSDLPLIVAALLGTAMLASSLLFLAWVRIEQVHEGYRIHALRDESLKLRHERAALDTERASLLRPERLQRLAREELALVQGDSARTVTFEALAAPSAAHTTLTATANAAAGAP